MPETHEARIFKQGNNWKVEPATLVVKKTDKIEWTVEGGVAADFQLPDRVFAGAGLNSHAQGKVKHGTGENLSVTVTGDSAVSGRFTYTYAVRIGDEWVIGENPPPKVDVGG